MTRFVFLISVLTLISCSQKNNQKQVKVNSSEKPTGTTEITFNEDIHDFGELKSGEIAVATFVFTNTGDNNFTIERVDSGCGCLHVKFPKEPIKPGKTGLIEVEFDSAGMFGRQYKSIEIHANCKEPKHLAIFAAVKNENLEIKY